MNRAMFETNPDRGRRTLIAALPWALLGFVGESAARTTPNGFDHRHPAWDALHQRHVVVAPGGNASALRYAALQAQRSEPKAHLGSLLQSPWKKKFFRLLGKERSPDEVEHEMIRAPGVFDDPRIPVAVVCASIGCPMLRNEAFVAERLDAQLDDALRRFLSDRSRNRFEASTGTGTGTLAVSKIFDWYRKDFEQGHKGYDSLRTLFARHADVLGTTPQAQAEIRAGRYKLATLDYDWALNDAR